LVRYNGEQTAGTFARAQHDRSIETANSERDASAGQFISPCIFKHYVTFHFCYSTSLILQSFGLLQYTAKNQLFTVNPFGSAPDPRF
jgi:hypothetical protein